MYNNGSCIFSGILTFLSYVVVPSTRLVKYGAQKPAIEEGSFVASNASVIGEVSLGKGSSVWYGATVRGDVNYITIGDYTNIQDNVVVHAAKIAKNDFPTIIGNNVTIGPNAIVHACTIGNQCIIGTGAVVLDGAEVGENSIVAAGSVVTGGKKVPAGQVGLYHYFPHNLIFM
jgi:carbonic anhydrase/acetyltransferase-like protein (isoleucine patch superfamily)